MKGRKWIPVLVVIVSLLQVFSLAGASAEALPNDRSLGLDVREPPLAAGRESNPGDAISIVVLPSDYRLPAPLVTGLKCKTVSLEKAITGDFDALLVSKEELSRLSRSNGGRRQIIEWLSGGRILLVMDSSTNELKDTLHIGMPTMDATTSKYLVSGVVQLSDGVFASGGVLLVKGRRYALQEEIQDIRAFTANLMAIEKKVTSSAMQTSYWRFEGVLSHYFDMCPFGKYNETVYAEQATNDGSPFYDFWNAQIDQQTIGGYSACGSSFQASRLWTRADAGMYWGQLLYRYGPTTTNANNITYVNVGLTAGYKGATVSLGKSWAFSLPDVYVIDHSDFSTQQAEWEFVYSHGANSAKYNYLSEPGVSVRTTEGYRLNLYRPINTYWWRHWWEGEYHLFDEWDLHF